MSEVTAYQRQDLFETETASSLTAAATTINIASAPDFTLSSGSFYGTIDPTGTPEIVEVTGMSGTVLTVTRGIPLYEGGPSSAAAHAGGVKFIISNNWKTFDKIREAIATKMDISGGTFTGPVAFSGASTSFRLPNLTTAQRTALTATNGMEVYDTDLGAHYVYVGGVWTSTGSTTVSNATTAVAGKAEEATQGENDAGTATGGAAQLFATPATAAATIQKNSWLYAADAGASDAYAITLTPAPAAYTTGMSIYFKANTLNTGTATLNVNGLGAKAILKQNNEILDTGDIQASQIVHVVYDGTNFQMMSPDQPLVAKGDLLVGISASSKPAVQAIGTNGYYLVADSTQTNGLKWAARPGFASGVATRAAATGTGTQNIAHGLGVTPRFIKLTATAVATADDLASMFSAGTAFSTTTEICVYHATPAGALSAASAGNVSGSIIYLINGDGAVMFEATVSTLDATNITLNFTTNAAAGGTANILWEAYE